MYTWSKGHSIVAKDVTAKQMWKLFADVNNWHTWDEGIEFAKMEGAFREGAFFQLRPKGGPTVKIKLVEAVENVRFTDMTAFPLAKMYGQHSFEQTPEGLRISCTMTVKGPLGFLWRRLVANKIVEGLPSEMPQQVLAAKKL